MERHEPRVIYDANEPTSIGDEQFGLRSRVRHMSVTLPLIKHGSGRGHHSPA